MKKLSSLILGCVWIAVSVLLIMFVLFGDTGRISRRADRKQKKRNGTTTAVSSQENFSGDINAISIDTVSFSITLESTDGTEISVQASGDDDRLSVSKDGSTLRIKEHKKIRLFGPGILDKGQKVTVAVPKRMMNKDSFVIDIDNTSGSIHMSDCTAKKISIENTNGSIKLEGCTADILKTENVSGSTKLHGSYNSINTENVSGSVHVNLEKPATDCRVETVSGSVHVSIPENDGFTLSYETVSGSVHNAFTEGKLSKSGNDTYKSGKASVSVETVSGSIHIEKK